MLIGDYVVRIEKYDTYKIVYAKLRGTQYKDFKKVMTLSLNEKVPIDIFYDKLVANVQTLNLQVMRSEKSANGL